MKIPSRLPVSILVIGLLLAACGPVAYVLGVDDSSSSGGATPDIKVDPVAATLVKDLNKEPVTLGSSPSGFVELQSGVVLFAATTPELGEELWKTEGTTESTVAVKDIQPGQFSSSPRDLTVVESAARSCVFFTATDAEHGRELWKSDGTKAGTVLVRDIREGCLSSAATNLHNVGGLLFFTAEDANSGTELWTSDGTEQGTELVRDITTDGDTVFGVFATGDGKAYFSVRSPQQTDDLWESDGTFDGTRRLRDWGDYASRRVGNALIDQLVATKGSLFVSLRQFIPNLHPHYNWMASFVLVRPGSRDRYYFFAGGVRSTPFSPSEPLGRATSVAVGGTREEIAFTAQYRAGRNAVYVVNTSNVLRFARGYTTLSPLAYVGTTLFYLGDGRLWSRSLQGRFQEVSKETSWTGQPTSLMALSDELLLFSAATHKDGRELWLANASKAFLLRDINPSVDPENVRSSNPTGLRRVLDKVFFSALVDASGVELWSTDGTQAGTGRVANLGPDTTIGGSRPSGFVEFTNMLCFAADDGTAVGRHGRELYTSDGTSDGTRLLSDLIQGPKGSSPTNLTLVGDALFFSAETEPSGRELWKTDGTLSGTTLVADIEAGTTGSHPGKGFASGNSMFFATTTTTSGRELWKTDGSGLGTVLVEDIFPGPESSSPSEFVELSGALFFAATTSLGRELWRTTGQGTRLVRDIRAKAHSSNPTYLVAFDGAVYFAADDGSRGCELWQSDGSTSGTVLVRDINPGGKGSSPADLLVLDGLLFFTATDTARGRELWISDGTRTGTRLLIDIHQGPENSGPSDLVALGDQVLFWANDGTRGVELWATKGSRDDTILLQDIAAGCFGERPIGEQMVAGNTLWFFAGTPAHGYELWRTDGTTAGTELFKELNPGVTNGGQPNSRFALLDGQLFVTADDGKSGLELWKIDPSASPEDTSNNHTNQ